MSSTTDRLEVERREVDDDESAVRDLFNPSDLGRAFEMNRPFRSRSGSLTGSLGVEGANSMVGLFGTTAFFENELMSLGKLCFGWTTVEGRGVMGRYQWMRGPLRE